MLAKMPESRLVKKGVVPTLLYVKGEGSQGGAPRVAPVYEDLESFAERVRDSKWYLRMMYPSLEVFISDLIKGSVRTNPEPLGRVLKIFLIKQQENLCVD